MAKIPHNSKKFDNYANGQLADAYGSMKDRIKALEVEAEELNTELKIRDKGKGAPIIGGKYTVSVTSAESARLDTKAAKAKLGKRLDPFYNTSTVVTVRYAANVEVDARDRLEDDE